MDNPKFQPFNLLALILSAATMGLLAYRNFSQGQTGYGVTFVVLCFFLLGLAIYGWKENRRQKNETDLDIS